MPRSEDTATGIFIHVTQPIIWNYQNGDITYLNSLGTTISNMIWEKNQILLNYLTYVGERKKKRFASHEYIYHTCTMEKMVQKNYTGVIRSYLHLPWSVHGLEKQTNYHWWTLQFYHQDKSTGWLWTLIIWVGFSILSSLIVRIIILFL